MGSRQYTKYPRRIQAPAVGRLRRSQRQPGRGACVRRYMRVRRQQRRVTVGSPSVIRRRSPRLAWGSRVGILILSMSPYDAEPGFPTADGLDTCPMIQAALGHLLRSNRPGADLPDVIHSRMSLVAGLRGCRFQGRRGHRVLSSIRL